MAGLLLASTDLMGDLDVLVDRMIVILPGLTGDLDVFVDRKILRLPELPLAWIDLMGDLVVFVERMIFILPGLPPTFFNLMGDLDVFSWDEASVRELSGSGSDILTPGGKTICM